jgi:choline dehydrogenase-like flavoprotein
MGAGVIVELSRRHNDSPGLTKYAMQESASLNALQHCMLLALRYTYHSASLQWSFSDVYKYATDPTAPRKTVLARREVILAAGAIHTPQLLQLSGLGRAALLRSLNISIAQDLPGVGSNLQDHCLVYVNYPCKHSEDF